MPGMPAPGADWAGFHIEEQIGAGGFGHVFAAWDRTLEQRVAIKVLAPDTDVEATERFVRESKVAAGLGHPRIVPIQRVDEHDGTPYVVMRYVAGGDLHDEITRGPLTVERAMSVVGQVGSALDRAHRSGLVHRAVEPSNVLCAEGSDDVYLTDFGVTRRLGEAADDLAPTETASAAATPNYAAPEQLRGEAVGPATDVYGLGCTLFECLTGRVPFPGENAYEVADHHLHRPPPKVTELRPDLPEELDDIVATAMAKTPRDRYGTSRELADALALVPLGGPPVTGPAALVPLPGADLDDTEALELASARSVFEDAGEPGGARDDQDTAVLPVAAVPVDGPSGDLTGDEYLDGAAFGVYEDDRPGSRTPALIIGLLAAASLLVGLLVWRAVNTDAELAADALPSTTTTTAALTEIEPTVSALRALVPDGIGGCVEPDGPGDAAGAGDDLVVLECPNDGVPESVRLELHRTSAARDSAFDALMAQIGVDDAGECALGRLGRHDYAAEDHGGSVACIAEGGRVDFAWTRDDVPVLVHASGGGRFLDYERWWSDAAGRTDGAFPLPEEQELLDALPDELTESCRRDLALALAAPGLLAVACEPDDAEPDVVSWVRFVTGRDMNDWIEGRRSTLQENTFDDTDDGCTPAGFGRPEVVFRDEAEGDGEEAEPATGPVPDAAYEDYSFDGTSGRVLCFLNTSGQNALFWTRDGSRIGSIAVSDASAGATMVDLLTWWRDGGHRP